MRSPVVRVGRRRIRGRLRSHDSRQWHRGRCCTSRDPPRTSFGGPRSRLRGRRSSRAGRRCAGHRRSHGARRTSHGAHRHGGRGDHRCGDPRHRSCAPGSRRGCDRRNGRHRAGFAGRSGRRTGGCRRGGHRSAGHDHRGTACPNGTSQANGHPGHGCSPRSATAAAVRAVRPATGLAIRPFGTVRPIVEVTVATVIASIAVVRPLLPCASSRRHESPRRGALELYRGRDAPPRPPLSDCPRSSRPRRGASRWYRSPLWRGLRSPSRRGARSSFRRSPSRAMEFLSSTARRCARPSLCNCACEMFEGAARWWVAPSNCGCVFGGVLLSHHLAVAVPSALEGLASGFGMGPGVSPSLWPPKRCELVTPGGRDPRGFPGAVPSGVGSACGVLVQICIVDAQQKWCVCGQVLGLLVPVGFACFQVSTSGLSTP